MSVAYARDSWNPAGGCPMFRPMALLKYGSVSLALLAVPYPAVAQSAAELRAEIDALRKENATLRERHRLSQAKRRDAKAARAAPCGRTGATARCKPMPPICRSKAPAPVIALPNWAGFYIGGGFGREQRKTRQGSVTVFGTNGADPGPDARDTNSLDQTSTAAPATSSAAGSGNMTGSSSASKAIMFSAAAPARTGRAIWCRRIAPPV